MTLTNESGILLMVDPMYFSLDNYCTSVYRIILELFNAITFDAGTALQDRSRNGNSNPNNIDDTRAANNACCIISIF